jgi:hypothetical protein
VPGRVGFNFFVNVRLRKKKIVIVIPIQICNFVALVKIKENTIRRKFKALAAILVVALMCSISFIQVFHNHAHVKACHAEHENSLVIKAAKCSVCDFFVHKSGKDFAVLKPLYVSVIFSAQITRPVILNAGTYTNPSGGFTNKGPPAS